MRALVVYESMFGNTQAIADAVADGLAARVRVDAVEVGAAPTVVGDDVVLLVVGGPTHAFGMSRQATRQDAGRQAERGLVSEESDQWQYRFLDISDPDTGKALFSIEHEVRSMTHPLYGRPLVNRNPYQTNRAFVAGHETRAWAMPHTA